jgi:Family of unknown function (DUF6951)
LATVEIDAGICGHTTTVTTTAGEGYKVHVLLESTCPHAAYAHCVHAACPVPSGLIKAIEVQAGLALPKDVSMRIGKEE